MLLTDLDLLECPLTRSPLHLESGSEDGWIEDDVLISEVGSNRFEVRRGVPYLMAEELPETSARQQEHYTKVAEDYLDVRQGLSFTVDYWEYLASLMLNECGDQRGRSVLEVCCGDGSFLFRHFDRSSHRIGIDITPDMLMAHPARHDVTLACGDALRLPVKPGAFDLVYLHGGVHHVLDRRTLFEELYRAVAPRGRLVCLEPIDDFFVHRWLRKAIYRYSKSLDELSEKPLRLGETEAQLRSVGFGQFRAVWCCYLAGAFFANTDVMSFMVHFSRVPGHRLMAKALTLGDEVWRHLPLFRRMSMLAVISAEKPIA